MSICLVFQPKAFIFTKLSLQTSKNICKTIALSCLRYHGKIHFEPFNTAATCTDQCPLVAPSCPSSPLCHVTFAEPASLPLHLVKNLWTSEIPNPQHLQTHVVMQCSPKPRLSHLGTQVYHFAVKGLRKYFSTYPTRTCGLFYDSRSSSIWKAMTHWVVVQQIVQIFVYAVL